jgi:hypothetical protein
MYEVSYSCSSTGALPTNGFHVSLTVTAQNNDNPNCDTVKTGDVELTSIPLPQVAVESAPVPSFCAADGSVLVDFNVTTDVPYGTTGASWSLEPTVLGQNNAVIADSSIACALKSVAPMANGELTKWLWLGDRFGWRHDQGVEASRLTHGK